MLYPSNTNGPSGGRRSPIRAGFAGRKNLDGRASPVATRLRGNPQRRQHPLGLLLKTNSTGRHRAAARTRRRFRPRVATGEDTTSGDPVIRLVRPSIPERNKRYAPSREESAAASPACIVDPAPTAGPLTVPLIGYMLKALRIPKKNVNCGFIARGLPGAFPAYSPKTEDAAVSGLTSTL